MGSGTVTRAQGRDIFEINGEPAGDVFLQWTGLSMPISPMALSQFALAFSDSHRLVDVIGFGTYRELQCFASTADELGRTEVQLVCIKPTDVIAAIKEVTQNVKD